jgi:hypothetical protein
MEEKPYRKIYGVRYSENYDKDFRIAAICENCLKNIEPPARVKNDGLAAVGACDWCSAKNEMYRKENAAPSPSKKCTRFLETFTKNHPDYSDYNDLPIERVNLEENFSPVIASPEGEFDDAVAVEKFNDFTYRLIMPGGVRLVSPEDLIRMRARYLLKSGKKGS